MANETGYDKISLLRGTEQELQSNIDKIQPYELMVAKDTRKAYYKTEGNKLEGLMPSITGIKELPDPSIYGSISSRNGRLYTSGAFNNIIGIENANVLEYVDSKIITTPDNSFNVIVEKDKLYTGPSYENIVPSDIDDTYTKVDDYKYKGSFLSGDSNKSIFKRGALLKPSTNYCFQIMITSVSDDRFISSNSFSVELRSNVFETLSRITVSELGKNYILTGKTLGNITGYAGAIAKLNDSLGFPCDVELQWSLTETDTVVPYIPLGYTFPDGALSFDGTENMNFDDYSYVMKDKKNSGGNEDWFISNHEGILYGTPSQVSKSNLVYSNSSKESSQKIYTGTYNTDILSITARKNQNRGLAFFREFLSYKSDLTQAELEAELAKNLFIEGEVDVISQIQTDMKVGAILGKRPQGNIDDGTLHKVDEIWYSNKLSKYYECITENSDDFVDTDKWKERSLMSVPYISISGYKVEVV